MRLFLTVILLSIFNCALAQSNLPYRFETINQRNGLSNNEVKCLYKDAGGFVWVGTEDGLNKYDGTGFKVYRHFINDSNSLVGNHVLKIRPSTNGKLWISSHCWGLSELNVYNGKSIQHKEDKLRPSKTLASNCDIDILQDDENNTWVKNGCALSLYHPSTKTFTTEFRIHKDTSIIYTFFYRKDIIWMGTLDGTIGYNIRTKQVISTPLAFDNFAASTLITKFINNDIVLSVGWQKGLNFSNLKTKQTLHLLDGVIVSDVQIITINNQKQLWVSSDQGLYIANYNDNVMRLTDNSFEQYLPDNNDIYSVASTFLGQILQDDKGVVWIASSNGVCKFNPSYLRFQPKYITGTSQTQTHFSYNPSHIFIHKNSIGKTHYWLSYWHGGGLLKLDTNFNLIKKISFEHYDAAFRKKNKSTNVNTVFEINKDTLGIACWSGIWLYDALNDKLLKNYKFNDNDTTQPKISRIDYAIYDDGKIWVGTYNQKLRVLDLKKNEWKIYDVGNKSGATNFSRHDYIFKDSKNRIWLSDGCYFNAKREIVKIRIEGNLTSITEDKKGNIWMASENGIGKFNEATQSIFYYNSSNGLLSNIIGKIIVDDDNNIWATSTYGLICINDEKKFVRNFTTADGLEANTIAEILYKMHDGNFITNIYTYNDGHFTTFNPKTLLEKQTDLPFHFTAVQVFNDERIFENNLDSIKKLSFTYKENSFSIHFKALTFGNTVNVKYRYKLSNVNNQWIDIGNQNSIAFTNLGDGKYELLVQATNAEGIWMSKILKIDLIIKPPFWRTNWFYILLVLLIAAILFIAVKRRIKTIKAKAALQQQLSNLEMKALRSQMNPHFIFNCLSSIQSTIINGEVIRATEYVDKFSLLLRTVLNQSERPTITLQEEIDYLTTYLELECFRYEDLAFKVNAKSVEDAAFIHIPSMLLQPFIENAIQHGLSHKVGEKKIDLLFEESNNAIKVTIKDNGIGRVASKEINKNRSLAHQSLGIKNIEDRLKILFKTNHPSVNILDEQQGTTVIIEIPIINNQ